ncbi:DBP7 [Malassezia furfur]|nr:DBP7 [Malassezia furfur]
MDDEDLLLNFDTSAPVRAPKRRDTRKRSARHQPYTKPAAAEAREAGAPAQESADDRAPKRRGRRRLPRGRRRRRRARLPTRPRVRWLRARRVSGHASAKGTGYISSLFARDEQHADEPQAVPRAAYVAPSNAPTQDGTFEGLGLERLLTRHLTTRMGVGAQPTEIQRLAIPPLLASPPDEAALRDVMIQAQTGSGKTLTYLLPIVQSLFPLSTESFIDRSVGTLAIVLAPTRELARQIYTVLEKLLAMSLATPDDEDAPRYARWMVPGLLTGGSTKNHEKQRLRKGCPILVATPGRLLDHLQNTSSLDVGKCRWLVLDEADRLLEMGFEEQLSGIIKALEGRRRLALQAARDAQLASGALNEGDADARVTDSLGIAWWAWRLRLVLCSATLDERVQLQQHVVVVPPKLRLVTLVALLRHTIPRAAQLAEVGPARVIVFMSSTDAVDFHWRALGGAQMPHADAADAPAEAAEAADAPLAQYSELLPHTPIYRLHGNMTQKERIASLRAFRTLTDDSGRTEARRGGVLVCTSVASRGLDLPDVRCVVQMDVPTEGVEEYVHRVGRTARAGRQGSSWLLLLPHEQPWLDTLRARMVVQPSADAAPRPAHLSGFGGAAREYESRATDVQMALERWVLAAPAHASLARDAFLSHIRAYTTHPTEDKGVFNVNQLHLGHLAKAFALREAPNTVQRTAKREHDKKTQKEPRRAAADDAEARRKRMLANLPTESM